MSSLSKIKLSIGLFGLANNSGDGMNESAVGVAAAKDVETLSNGSEATAEPCVKYGDAEKAAPTTTTTGGGFSIKSQSKNELSWGGLGRANNSGDGVNDSADGFNAKVDCPTTSRPENTCGTLTTAGEVINIGHFGGANGARAGIG